MQHTHSLEWLHLPQQNENHSCYKLPIFAAEFATEKFSFWDKSSKDLVDLLKNRVMRKPRSALYWIGKKEDMSTDCIYHWLVILLTSRYPRSGSPVLSLLSKPCIFMAEELNNVSTAFDTTFSFIKQTKKQMSCADCPRCYQPNWNKRPQGYALWLFSFPAFLAHRELGICFTRNKNTVKHFS